MQLMSKVEWSFKVEEFIISKEELHEMFEYGEIVDTHKGWYYEDIEIEIIAIHTIEKKYIQDIMNADEYKIREV